MDWRPSCSSARRVVRPSIVRIGDGEKRMHDVVQSALGRVRDAHPTKVKVVAHKTFVSDVVNATVAPVAERAVHNGQGRARVVVAGEVAGDADRVELVREAMPLANDR